jgi:hypothetical protein
MSLDGLPPAHLRVLLDGLPVFERYGLLLAGGYAFRAHEIVHRPSQDLDFATRDDTPLPEIAARVQAAFQHAGYGVRLAEAASPRYARLILRLRAVETAGGQDAFDAAVAAMLDDARGWRLAELRKRRGMTQEQVAVRMGVSVARVPRSRAAMSPPRMYRAGSSPPWTALSSSPSRVATCV